METETVHVLLVEDNEVDREAVERALREQRIGNPIHVARDGIEALELLRAADPPFPRPYLILLDLNMPRMDGIEFLKEIRDDASLHDSIVFVLTTSNLDEDKVAAYDSNVAGYMVKEDAGNGFLKLIGMLDHYWRVVEFPPPPR